jgi:hypothetical protein
MAFKVCAALEVAGSDERAERRSSQRGFLDRGGRILLEVAGQPASSDPWVPRRAFPRDQQRQLERVVEAELRQLARRGQRGDDVPSPDRLLEDPI